MLGWSDKGKMVTDGVTINNTLVLAQSPRELRKNGPGRRPS